MRSFLKYLPGLAALLLLTGLPAVAKSDKDADAAKAATDKAKDGDKKKKGDKDKGKGKGKKPDDKTAAAGAGTGNKISLPLVPGHDSFGLKIPYTDEQGRLQMIYYIGVATRLDEDKLRMKETKVETYNEEGEVEMTVDLPISELDLNTKIVTSDTQTTIKREDFTITGDTVRFNTVTKEASLVGHVRMIVYDLNDEAGKPPTPAATRE